MKASLFQRGLGMRVSMAAAYGLLAFGAVSALESAHTSPARPDAAPSVATPAELHATLCIESVASVAHWAVRLDGEEIAPDRSDDHVWIARINSAAAASVLIEAAAVQSTEPGPNSMRIRVAGTPEARDQVFWCAREWTVVARLDRIARAAAPIDPTELP